MNSMVQALAKLLAGHGLRLVSSEGQWIVHHGSVAHLLASLPVDGIAGPDERAELLALAAGIESAIQVPGAVEPSTLLEGSASLLPRIERARFVLGYDAVLQGRGAEDDERLLQGELGGGLVVLYVRDAGWRFHYVVRGQMAQWGSDLGQLHQVARSNLYHRAELDPDVHRVSLGDGYDAARVLLASDVFFTLGSREAGLPIALPGRDLLLVGPEATPATTREAFEQAEYPLSSQPMVWSASALHGPSGAS